MKPLQPLPRKLPSHHFLHEYRGTPEACGRAYGFEQAESIRAFLNREVKPNEWRQGYAKQCWKYLRNWIPEIAAFARGMAEGAGLTEVEVALLLAHEEVYHSKHCTGFGATGAGAKNGKPVIGQNWDWSPELYACPSLLRIRQKSLPVTLTYSYPGLWACAGINEHGLSLVWTGAAYFPYLEPAVGVPTYALIAGILTQANCDEAIKLLRKTRIAGHFIFFLADPSGALWVVESVAGNFEAVQSHNVIGRANHYECRASCDRAGQVVPPNGPKANSGGRGKRMAQLMKQHRGNIDRKITEQILSDHGMKQGLSICQHPTPERNGITIDSFYALPAKREFWIARGHPCRHRYERYRVT